MTTVTISKKRYNLEQLVADALEMARTIRLNTYEQAAADRTPEQEPAIRFCKSVRHITGWEPRRDKMTDVDFTDTADVTDAVGALLKKWNRRAGTRALVQKYGVETAEKIVEEKTGRHYDLQG